MKIFFFDDFYKYWDRFFFGVENIISSYLGLKALLRISFYVETISYNSFVGLFKQDIKSDYSFTSKNKYLFKYPPIDDAKVVCEFLTFKLEEGLRVKQVFFLFKKWNLLEMRKRNTFLYFKPLSSTIVNSYFPLGGVRVLVSGPLYKAGRRKKLYYHLYARRGQILGKMPFSEPTKYTKYHSLQARLKSSSVGLKVWIFFDKLLSTILENVSCKKEKEKI